MGESTPNVSKFPETLKDLGIDTCIFQVVQGWLGLA
jgi:hypothetical protein